MNTSLYQISFLVYLSACIISPVLSVTSFDLIEEEWKTFKLQYNESYGNPIEDSLRLKAFMHNRKLIAKHNSLYARGLVSYALGLNPYSDMLHTEFMKTMNGFKVTNLPKLIESNNRKSAVNRIIKRLNDTEVDHEFDWRQKGAVTPVKNQRKCGSCWAFSATGALEGLHFIKSRELISLSEQNLIDCGRSYGADGCHAGNPMKAFFYVEENGGIETENHYPYEAKEGKCRYNVSGWGATDMGFMDIPDGDEIFLKNAVANIGPISVGVDARGMQLYEKGVYYNEDCLSEIEDLNHAMLVVGYGTTEKGEDYWLVKNSWGKRWGMKGYIMMARNRNNACGIASSASAPLFVGPYEH